MCDFEVEKIKNLLSIEYSHLVLESKENGFRFLDRLVNDYKNGENTFDKDGESLFGVFNQQGTLIAIGGLNIDPFSGDEKVCRLRRFYVSDAYRRKGIGTLLLNTIVSEAKNYFNVLVLHTDTEEAAKYYKAYGFHKDEIRPNSTHYINL
ncbi:GNAT family N-acetyltransferase [Neobacillus terrae]|uniref:GNAT family N-acetyltransferase n=1 Tax=Neobacillus terrae TaxID=3034837 RepID=UPI00140C1085|nr:GNAT family N-acetyltransferase [Neobacillus terrae]NHM30888.1 GNAT family N-acetyltransferase [Neobacillus terrae]